jgi:hypothetical protein
MRRTRAAATAALLTILIAACSPAATTENHRVAIRTEPASAEGCMEALITGELVAHPQWGIAIQVPGTGELMLPIFPFGYSAAVDGARIALIDENSRLVAHTGDLVQSSGGNIGGEGNPTVVLCDDTIKIVPG